MKTIRDTDAEFICDIQSPCFQILTHEEVELVRESKTQVIFRKGDNLAKQGAFASYVLFIIKGIALQYVEDERSKSFNLRIIKPGEFVGLSTVFKYKTFNYSASALSDCQAFLIEKDAIVKIMKQNGSFAYDLINRYCEQNTNLFDTLRKVLYKQMHGRMADAILYLNEIKNEIPDLFASLSRKDIADFAGVTPENAVKMLKIFHKDKFIELVDKDILILNQSGLIEISRKG